MNDDPSAWWVTRGLAETMLTAGYRLEEPIGRGGMAVVFRAHDVRLNRTVALKIVAPEHAADESYKQRFISESRAAAAVDHQNIVPIYEAGEARGVLFIAMRFVRAGDVSSLVREQPLPAARVAEIVRQAASALDKAHAHGLVHRDIKPENMLLDSGDEHDGRADHLYLSDFGLSKGVLRTSGLTPTGLFVGTLDYISPEQLEDKPLDGRADQYSLGCSAFKMLSSAPPFRRDSGPAVIAAHLWAPPPVLTSLRPDLPLEVNDVFAKVLAKSPQDRYPTCAEFARALGAALAQLAAPAHVANPALGPSARSDSAPTMSAAAITYPSSGHPGQAAYAGPAPDGRRSPGRRGKIMAGSIGGIVIVAALGLGIAHLLTGWPNAANTRRPPPAAGSGRHKGSADSLSAPRLSAGRSASPGSSGRSGPSGPSTSLPQNAGGSAPPTVLDPGPGNLGTNAIAFSPTGVLAAGGASGKTFLWNPANGNLITTLTDSGSAGVLAIAFSPDGKALATGDQNHHIYLWNTSTGTLTRTLTDSSSKGVLAVAFSPDGKTLATGDQNHHIYLWNTSTGTLDETLTDPASNGVDTLAFSPDGRTLAAGDYNGAAYLWRLATGGLIATLAVPPSDRSAVDAVAFSPDGSLLAAGAYDGTTYLWQVATLNLTTSLTDPSSGAGVEAIAFSPDGQALAAGDVDGSTYLWRLSDASLIGTFPLPGAGQHVWAVAFSPSGRLLATGDRVGGTDVWKIG